MYIQQINIEQIEFKHILKEENQNDANSDI